MIPHFTDQHRRIAQSLEDCLQSGDDPRSRNEKLDRVRTTLLRHFEAEDQFILAPLSTAPCASAWVIVEESKREHARIRELVRDLEARSSNSTDHVTKLEALRSGLAKTFADEEARLFDEAQRHFPKKDLAAIGAFLDQGSHSPKAPE